MVGTLPSLQPPRAFDQDVHFSGRERVAEGLEDRHCVSVVELHAQGQLNVHGPADLALVSELPIPDAKLATFKTACYNPTISGTSNTTGSGSRCARKCTGSARGACAFVKKCSIVAALSGWHVTRGRLAIATNSCALLPADS